LYKLVLTDAISSDCTVQGSSSIIWYSKFQILSVPEVTANLYRICLSILKQILYIFAVTFGTLSSMAAVHFVD